MSAQCEPMSVDLFVRPEGAACGAASVPVAIAATGEFVADDRLHAARERIWDRVLRLYETGLFPGISVCVVHHHQRVLHRAVGYASVPTVGASYPSTVEALGHLSGKGVPMTPEQPACLFSASKMVTAMLVHWAVEQGDLCIDAPLSDTLPQLVGTALGRLTLQDVLTHRAGVPRFPKEIPIDVLFDEKASLASLIPLNPQSITEDSAAYHAVTGGVLAGAALASVYKMGLPRLLDRVFRKPLGLRYFSFGLSAAAQRGTEFVHEYITGVKPNVLLQQWVSRLVGASFQEVVRITHDPRFRRAVIPAVNVYATAEEVCCFFQMLMQHGRYGTQQVLAPATVSAALRPMGGWCFDRQFMLPMRYSKGFMLGANPLGLWGPFSEKSFGHLGFTNKWSWAIPHSQTAVCLLSNGNCLAGAPIKPMVQFVLEVQRLGGLFT